MKNFKNLWISKIVLFVFLLLLGPLSSMAQADNIFIISYVVSKLNESSSYLGFLRTDFDAVFCIGCGMTSRPKCGVSFFSYRRITLSLLATKFQS